jgi:exopolyphosphatase / guanosine-5'-triphosphate,3'-diphosphate pyrophosphatase
MRRPLVGRPSRASRLANGPLVVGDARRVAAVDIGTNSCRLLVAEAPAGQAGFTTLDRQLRITRLGQDVDATGRLADAAIARTVDAVAAFAQVWQSLDVAAVRITATSAARDSANARDFAAAIQAVAGVAPEVLSGEAEAATAFRGAISGLAMAGLPDVPLPVVVLDIGGGSTELVLGETSPLRSTSRQLGCVRLTERVLAGDPPTAGQIERARDVVTAELDAIESEVAPSDAVTLVAVAGTATTLAALHLGMAAYDPGVVHGTAIPAGALSQLADRLLGMQAADIRALGPVDHGREDVLAAGALILDAVVTRFGFAEVRISETDILDGLVLGLLDGPS